MVQHICENCGKVFKKRWNYNYHINRKFPCKKKKSQIDVDSSKPFKCSLCSSRFATKSNLNRHIIKCQENFGQMVERIDINRELMELKNQIKEYIDSKTGITFNTNIIINNFGSETIDHINNKFLMDLFNRPEKSVPKLIKEIHFSESNKVNRNIYLPQKKNKTIYIFNNGEWVEKNKDKTLNALISKNFDRLDDFFETNKKELENKKIVKYEQYADDFDYGTNRRDINSDVCNIIVKETNKDLQKKSDSNI